LRNWIEGATACTVPGTFTGVKAEGSIVSRAVISSGAVVRPALKLVAMRIRAADDKGAWNLFLPVMRMIGGVLGRLFQDGNGSGGGGFGLIGESIVVRDDGLKSACIKFLEIVVLCFSRRGQAGNVRGGGRGPSRGLMMGALTPGDEFALDDLPMGHHTITRQALEEIGEHAFNILRGLCMVGGQVRVDMGVKKDIMLGLGLDASGSDSTKPLAQIIAILEPAALSFLLVESTHNSKNDTDKTNTTDEDGNNTSTLPKPLDRSSIEMDFTLAQKSYSVTINAISMLAIHRPIFFQDFATCLARRTIDLPPIPNDNDDHHSNNDILLTKSATIAVRSHLKASCLTLLRHTLSLTTKSSTILHSALSSNNMKQQADKALKKAQDDLNMKNSSRRVRDQAAIYYEWDSSANNNGSSQQHENNGGGAVMMDNRGKKRHDALERMRIAKAARGLGNGIQLPVNMADAVELVMINLANLPASRAAATAGSGSGSSGTGEKKGGGGGEKRKRPMNLDFVVDAIMTNGASLVSDESRWYIRDGGAAWMMDVTAYVSDDDDADNDNDYWEEERRNITDDMMTKRGPAPVSFTIDTKTLAAADASMQGKSTDESKLYVEQCKMAASDAFHRIVTRASTARERLIADFGNSIASRLAWSLKRVKPSQELGIVVGTSIVGSGGIMEGGKGDSSLGSFADDYPLIPSCFALDMETSARIGAANVLANRTDDGGKDLLGPSSSLTNRILNEAYLEDITSTQGQTNESLSECMNQRLKTGGRYEKSLNVYVLSILDACKRADEKPNDTRRKRLATVGASALPQQLAIVPAMTPSALELTSAMCDITAITKKATEASRKASSNIALNAAMHATLKPYPNPDPNSATIKAAEKRATGSLYVLRDAAFQRTKGDVRRSAIDCAVGIATGRLPASPSIEDKALKLVINVLFPKSTDLANTVVASATEELERASVYAIKNFDRIKKANERAAGGSQQQRTDNHSHSLQSDEEKVAMERVRKPVILFAALCLRRPEIIKTLMSISCRKDAHILAKAVRNNMPKLARSAAIKYGDAKIALQVAELADESETQLLFAFLDNLTPVDGNLPSQDLIDACHFIQSKRVDSEGKKDPRFIIPIVSGMKRQDLVAKLPEFVAADDIVFKAALRRMSERLGRHALIYRDEPNADSPSMNGITLCEQIVFLQRMDFNAAYIPQKRYLDALSVCLEDDTVFTHSVIRVALDHISETFLAGEALPLAYMRITILTCNKYDSLHVWICDDLLPRLIEGGVYTDRRQWQGWINCANMLENTSDAYISSLARAAIEKLPQEQLQMYKAGVKRKRLR